MVVIMTVINKNFFIMMGVLKGLSLVIGSRLSRDWLGVGSSLLGLIVDESFVATGSEDVVSDPA